MHYPTEAHTVPILAKTVCTYYEQAAGIHDTFKIPLHGNNSQIIFTLEPVLPRKATLSIIPLHSGLAFCQYSPVPGVNVLKINYIAHNVAPSEEFPVFITPKRQNAELAENTAIILSTGMQANGYCNFERGILQLETPAMQLTEDSSHRQAQAGFIEQIVTHFEKNCPINYLNMHNYTIYSPGIWFRSVDL